MRIFVTGGTGFVGSHAVRHLVEHRHDVHALVLESDPRPAVEGVTRISGDLLRPSSYFAALEQLRPEACIHLGWYANPSDYLSHPVNVDLIGASAALGAKLVELGCRRLVGAGTCFEYDTSLGFLTETTPLAPRHLYSTCKRAVHDILAHFVAGTGTTLTWGRLFFLYGPHESGGRLVPAVIDSLLSGNTARVSTGEQIRDFLHVADAAAALVHALETESLSGAVNIASGNPVAVRDIVATIARLLGAETNIAWGAIQPRPNDPSFICGDVTKLKRAGFTPRHDLESGLRDTIAWSRTCRKS